MPNFTYDDQVYSFSYDSNQSTLEGRTVTNQHNILHAEQATIIFPSGTGNLQIWVNNDRLYNKFVQTNYQAMFSVDSYTELGPMNVLNPSFSANWINIMTLPSVVSIPSNNLAVVQAPFRYIRLQGTAATGGAIAFLNSQNSEPGM